MTPASFHCCCEPLTTTARCWSAPSPTSTSPRPANWVAALTEVRETWGEIGQERSVFLIHAGTLTMHHLPARVMHAQLVHLLDLLRRDPENVRVLPMNATVPGQAFNLLRLKNGFRDTVEIHGNTVTTYLSAAKTVKRYFYLVNYLTKLAMPKKEALDLVGRLVQVSDR